MMDLTQFEAWIYLPFIFPICLYVAYTDMREMRIINHATDLMVVLFLILGLFALPFDTYLWRVGQFVVVLVFAFLLNMAGAMGAGDSKFLAAAAPYVATGDALLVWAILMACLLAAFTTHRVVRASPLRNLAPHWQSWTEAKFPMGLALGGTLGIYLGLGAIMGT